MLTPSDAKIALFIPTFGDGGVERMLVNLACGFSAHGAAVDFLVKDQGLPYLAALTDKVKLVELTGSHPRQILSALQDYLRQQRPAVLMSAKLADDRLAIAAKRSHSGPTRVFLRVGTSLSARLAARRRNPLKRWLSYQTSRRLCLAADGVICVSQGVADDLSGIVTLPTDKLHILRNPVVTPELAELAKADVVHPWLRAGEPPLILGSGGLRTQKNFSLLVRAFAKLRQDIVCRLMILGEGRQRQRLLQLADQLGVAESVALPGFVTNPYSYMAKAGLFVLSSDWEGSPNVLVEALAVGTPVVATDCPSGPREILQQGRYGTLVPVGDEEALNQAMRASLTGQVKHKNIQDAALNYLQSNSSAAYLRAFGLWHEPS